MHSKSSHSRTLIPFWFVLLLLPVFYLNVNNCFDWGDDYAQYLQQAKNIIEGKPQHQTGMAGIQVYSPVCRPSGFPVLLSPFYFLFARSATGYLYVMSAFLFSLALVYFLFLRSYANSFISALLAILFIYHPLTLRLKAEVLAEIPLTLCIVAAFYLSHRHKRWFTLLFILIAVLLKYAGLVLWLAFVLYELKKLIFKNNGNKKPKANFLFLVYLICIPAVYALINHILLKIPLANETWYHALFFNGEIISTIQTNAIYYCRVLLHAFEQEVPGWYNMVLKIGIPIFLLTGIIIKWKERVGASDIFFVIYILMILAYPYSKGGYRFIFPIMPVLFLYLYYGLNFYFVRIKGYSAFPITIFLLFILLSYAINIKFIQRKSCATISGPHEKDFKEAVIYCKAFSKQNDVILFARPWALKFFSGCNASPFLNEWNSDELESHLNRYRINYILSCNKQKHELYQPGLQNFISTNENCKVLWSNSTFSLYGFK